MGTALIPHQIYFTSNKYDPKYCEEMVRYFTEAPQRVTETTKVIMESSSVRGTVQRQEAAGVVATLPTFERFAGSIGVTRDTILIWAKRWPEFKEAHERCKDIQRDFIFQGLGSGRMPGMGGIFVAKNLALGLTDDTTLTVQHTGTRERPILAQKTPAQLEALKALALAAEAAGVKVHIEDVVAEPHEG